MVLKYRVCLKKILSKLGKLDVDTRVQSIEEEPKEFVHAEVEDVKKENAIIIILILTNPSTQMV